LPAADNQSHVRLRFAHAGTDSWYFGIDEVGFYSIASVASPVATAPTPATQTVAVGNSATLTVSSVGPGPFTYQWRRNGTVLAGKTNPVLVLPLIHLSEAGTYDVVVSNSGGSVTSAAPAAVISVINPTVLVTGQWDFYGSNLAATVGTDLQYSDTNVAGDTTFGSTADFGLPQINGQDVHVLHFVPSLAPWGGYKMFHGAAPNGGGAYVNQYTLIYDIYVPFGAWRSLLQTGANTTDADLFINPTGGIGISSVYDGNVSEATWHRVAVAFDLTGPGQAPVLTKFIDGVKVGNQTGGLSARDGRFALDVFALLFADNDGDISETFVSSIQFSNGRRSDEFLAALGGPSSGKIPGGIKPVAQPGGGISIQWSGTSLQSADDVNGPWTTIAGAAKPYQVPAPLGAKKFYRAR
jgi:hypothetical protein